MMIERLRGRVQGTVQGVGFRPFVARLAGEMELAGWVRNEGGAVALEIEGEPARLEQFGRRLLGEPPPAARVDAVAWHACAPTGERGFRIARSTGEARQPAIPPDLAMCAACAQEIDDPAARRHAYPFTNCTGCGPRFTIARGLPYDRARTSMAGFAMCPDCAREHGDPGDRRYHAQPIACPACGPTLALRDPAGALLARGGEALDHAIEALRRGRILALQGVGGYQLLVDAGDQGAVQRLRARKHRPEKPLAVLVADLDAARDIARLDAADERALADPAAPIVLVDARPGGVAPAVAPGTPRLGIMLPASPLHLLLARRLGTPVVATSGNLRGEPIATDPADALARLGGIADVFLDHDRPIVRRCDDSVVQVVLGRARVLRLARGLAPATIALDGVDGLPAADAPPVLAVGAHLKQAPALAADGRIVLWPHVGDLDSARTREAMAASLADMQAFLGVAPAAVAADAHPDYATSLWAWSSGRLVIPVQHHHAHVAACLAEHGEQAALGVAWDGVGLGADRTLWGGEFLDVTPAGFTRVAWLRPFPLPGGDAAARDGRRALAGLCAEAGLPVPALAPAHAGDMQRLAALARSPRLAPLTSSAGRLFDAVAVLTGVAVRSTYEGQAAMAVEHLAAPGAEPYAFGLSICTAGCMAAGEAGRGPGVGPGVGPGIEIDWRPMLAAMIAERGDPARVAARFHATLVDMIVRVACARRARVVALSGGCFQNRLLATAAHDALRARGLRVLLPARVPAGDGGLAVGQAWVAAHHLSGQGPIGQR